MELGGVTVWDGLPTGYAYNTKAHSVGDKSVTVARNQSAPLTTDEKRVHLRKWALETSGGEPVRLPTIREAREWAKSFFGDAPGAGLGTDVITKLLRDLRLELSDKTPTPGAVGTVEIPATPAELMDVVAKIAQLMKAAGLSSLVVDSDGFPVRFERFQKG
jgi:hypothetical protein